jgi:hypothetical protein
VKAIKPYTQMPTMMMLGLNTSAGSQRFFMGDVLIKKGSALGKLGRPPWFKPRV